MPHLKKITLLALLFCSAVVMSQEENSTEISEQITENEVAISEIEQAPYPNTCRSVKDDPKALKQCLSDYIANIVGKNFKTKKLKNLKPGLYRVSVQFKIDKNGKVVDVKARTNNSDTKIEEEAIRIVSKIPRMNPGIVDGKSVGVIYGFPINFRIPEKEKNN